MTQTLSKYLAVALLVAFFLPYLIKLRFFDLTVLLILGVMLPIYDLYRQGRRSD